MDNLKVIYCMLSLAAVWEKLPHQELVRFNDAVVIAIDDQSLFQLLTQTPYVELLYFSQDDYRHATRKLPIQEVEGAINRRRNQFSRDPLNEGFNRLYELERIVLTCAAAASTTVKGNKAKSLRLSVEANLRAMRMLVTDARYDEDVPFSSVLIALLESESMLLAELLAEAAALAHHGETQLRRDFADPVMAYLAEHGHKEYAEFLPFMDPTRAVFVKPADSDFTEGLRVRMEPFVNWRDGVMIEWRVREISNLVAQGKTVTRLYASSSAFLEEAATLTEAQLERELSMRVDADEAFHHKDLADYVNLLRLEANLLRGTVAEKAKRTDPVLATVLEVQLQKDTDVLLAALRRHPSWSSVEADKTQKPLAQLARAEQCVIDEAAFLARLAMHYKRTELSRRISAFHNRKEQDIESIALRP